MKSSELANPSTKVSGVMRKLATGFLASLVITVTFGGAVTPASANITEFGYVDDGDGNAIVTGCLEVCPVNLIIPTEVEGKRVTRISQGAFDNKLLESVQLPSTLISMGDSAFSYNKLTSLTLPNSVTSLGRGAFAQNLISSLTLSTSMTSIPEQGFQTNKLATLTIPSNIISVGRNGFSRNLLTSLVIPETLTSLEGYAFQHNLLTSLVIPETLTSVVEGEFANNLLTSVSIPSSWTTINDEMFAGNKLQAFTIPSTVTKIVNYAFDENLLTSLVIPETITSIGRNAFANNLLTSAVFQGNAPEEGRDVFEGNAGLMWLDVPPISTGWSDYWSDVPIRRVAKAFASTRPSIGNAVVYSKGISILTARKGIWTGSPTPVISYQWYACTKLVKSAQTTVPKSCKKISKATSSVHKFARTSKGEYLSVAVTGKSGATSATMWLSRSTELKYQLLK